MTDPVPQPSATALPVASESAPAPYRPGYEVVAEQILDLISDRALNVGDRLPTERELAELLGVSRTVTREAVKILSALGRISVRKGSGLFVARAEVQLASSTLSHFHPTEAAQVQMLFDFRRLVESESARQAAQVAMPPQVVELHAAARRCTAAAAEDDYREFGTQDRQFHLALAAAANNMFILNGVETVGVYVDQVGALLFHDRAPGSLVVAAKQHQRIADAVAAGERDVAVAVMIEHIDTTQSQLSRRIRERLISIMPGKV